MVYRGGSHRAPVSMGEFEVLPRLRLRSGRAVRTDGGVVTRPDTLALINGLLADIGRVLVWDLDGIERERPSLDLFRPFEGDAVWLDAGVRTANDLIDVLVAGVEKAVIGTRTLRQPSELDEARDLSEDIVVQVDLDARREGRFRGWSVRRYLDWSVRSHLESCLVVSEKTLPIVDVPSGSIGAYVGLATPADFAALRAANCRGAIVDAWEVQPSKT